MQVTINEAIQKTDKVSAISDIQRWLAHQISSVSEIPIDLIDEDEELTVYLSSIEAMSILGALEEKLELRIEPTTVYYYPTLSKLSVFIYQEAMAVQA